MPTGDHGVAGLDRLVHGVVAHERLAVVLLEDEALEGDVTWSTLELEGLEHAVGGLVAVEHAVEAVGIALVVAVDVAPAAAVARLPALDRHLVLARAEPLHQQVWVGVGAEDEVARGVELAGRCR